MKGDMQQLRDDYGVPAKKGGRVIYAELYKATIAGAWLNRHGILYLRIRLDGDKFTVKVHPTERVEYLPEGEK